MSIWSARCFPRVWTLGDFTTVYFVSSGAPGLQHEVLATYGFHEAFDFGYPNWAWRR